FRRNSENFMITTDVPAIYMQEFWAIVSVYRSSIRFTINKKKVSLDVDIFRDILQFCPKIPRQVFEDLPLEQDILSFIRDLGHTRDITDLTDVNVDYLHQPWRAFATVINKGLNGKETGMDKILLQLFQIEYKDAKKTNKMSYPIFMKIIIDYFMSKDPSISRRNKMFWHTTRDDTLFTSMRCGKCVFNSNHDACVSRYLKDVNARTKKPQVVPISASKPKRKANKSVATPHKKTVASDTTIQKSKSYYKKLYENTNQEWKWWIAKRCPSGYTWTQKPLRTKKIWMPKVKKNDESTSISPTIDIVSRITNIVQLILFIVDSGCTKHMTGNLKLLCNFVEKFLGTVHFGNRSVCSDFGYWCSDSRNVYDQTGIYCFVWDLQGNDFTNGSRDLSLHNISDGENLDKMKEKGDPCVMVGYSTQSKGYRVYNKRTRLIVESIHIKFDETKEMMSDHNSQTSATQRQEMSVNMSLWPRVPPKDKGADYDNSDPVPPRQNIVPTAEEKTDSYNKG
ncbi:hypothetical protein Tco_0752085, partial [Tanacetum coccineum]